MADEAKPHSSSFIKLPRMAKDLTGREFGRLVAVGPVSNHKKRGIKWLVRCSCGGTAEYFANLLLSGKNRSCGCIGRPHDLAGQRFGRLVALTAVGKARGSATWQCRCDCGNETIVPIRDLRAGNTKSCGCLKRETLKQMHVTHGMTGTPTYHSWSAMHGRCRPEHPQHADYHDRGIYVCERWCSFENFLADMGEQPGQRYSVDRRDNDGPLGNAQAASQQHPKRALGRICWRKAKRIGSGSTLRYQDGHALAPPEDGLVGRARSYNTDKAKGSIATAQSARPVENVRA